MEFSTEILNDKQIKTERTKRKSKDYQNLNKSLENDLDQDEFGFEVVHSKIN